MNSLTRIEISGFKSIRQMDLELRPLNVLIGANGSGKSNLLSALGLLKAGTNHDWLRDYVIRKGQASSLLHYGPKTTPETTLTVVFEMNAGKRTYRQRLIFGAPDILMPAEHEVRSDERFVGLRGYDPVVSGWSEESLLAEETLTFIGGLNVFQFDDTTAEAGIRRTCYVEDNRSLRPDGGNLAAFLYAMKRTKAEYYRRIIETIRQLAPFFDDFDLAPQSENPRNILLNWRERGSDHLFGPHQLSDGTLRATALVTLLLQPEPPDVIIIDEPELGMHPYAINILASLVRGLAAEKQVILATQSPLLVDQFEPEDIVVVERPGKESAFKRLDPKSLEEWLKEYSLSELWEKNVLGGVPGA